MENKYYVYFHINPLTNKVFYVGKGHNKRAYEKRSRNQYWKNTVAKYGYIVDIIESGLTNIEAGKQEMFYIKWFGRNNLVNMTDGGEGCVNPSIETRAKIAKTLTGLKQSEETKTKRTNTLTEIWKSEELRELKRNQSIELHKKGIWKHNIGKPSKKKGIKLSQEIIDKTSIGLKEYYKTNKPHNFIEICSDIKQAIFNDYENGLNKFKLHKKYNLSRTIIERLIKEYGTRT